MKTKLNRGYQYLQLVISGKFTDNVILTWQDGKLTVRGSSLADQKTLQSLTAIAGTPKGPIDKWVRALKRRASEAKSLPEMVGLLEKEPR